MRKIAILIGLAAAAGCSGKPGRVTGPDIDGANAAAAAIAEYDANGDSHLESAELTAAPELAAVLSRYDDDGDTRLSASELAAGIDRWSDGKVALLPWAYQVTYNGRPLSGAEVKLVPAPYLGDAVKAASSTSDSAGRGSLAISLDQMPANAPKRPLVQPGLYRVEITHPSTSIPEKYNSATTLGLEASSETSSPSGTIWALTGGR
jgi:hypothetical protein